MYVPTKHSTTIDKAKFCQHFGEFVNSNYDMDLFNKWFYRKLGCMFGLSLHYNRISFYQHWFTTYNRRYEFMLKILVWKPRGDPSTTYSDVELAIKQLAGEEDWLPEHLDLAIVEYNAPDAGDHLLVPKVMLNEK